MILGARGGCAALPLAEKVATAEPKVLYGAPNIASHSRNTPGAIPWGHVEFHAVSRRSQRPWLTICITGGDKLLLLSWVENCLSQIGKGNCSKGQWKKRKLLKFKAYASGSRKFTRQVLNCTFLWYFKNASRLECEIREASGETCHVLSAFTRLPSGTGLICSARRNTSSTSEVWEPGQLRGGREGGIAGCAPSSRAWLQFRAASSWQQMKISLAAGAEWHLPGLHLLVVVEGLAGRQQQSLKRSVCFHTTALSWELVEV